MKNKIKLFSPKINKKEIIASGDTLESHNWASGAGNNLVKKFEEKFCKYIGSKECVAVDSGTAALHLALNLAHIKGKEILVPSFTFVTTVHAITYNGGIPVFVDIEPNTLSIDLNDLENKITRKTKAVVPVYFGGFPLEMRNLKKIARKKSLKIIEDAAHACGTKNKNKMVGSENEFCCFSFHPVKNLAMPKGGAITINTKNSKKVKKKLNSLRWCGIDERKGAFYDVTSLGYNYYMDEISASIGIEQLKKIQSSNKKRYDIAKRYSVELNLNKKMPLDKDSSYHLYWIRVKNRKEFMENMMKSGIETGAHYPPVHLMTYYKKKTLLPNTEQVGKDVVTLPMHPNLTDEEINFVIKKVNSFIE
jgi:dTDP-4-amino-4,6-dideoxygalactose transaminase